MTVLASPALHATSRRDRPARHPAGGRALAAAAFAALALASAPRPAAASPNGVSETLQKYVATTEPKVTTEPSIIGFALCHTTSSNLCKDYFYTPFGLALKAQTGCPLPRGGGTVLTDKFLAAFARLDADRVDTDCDGFPDIDEVRANTNPSARSDHPSGDPPLGASCAGGGDGGSGGDGGGGDDDDGDDSGNGGGAQARPAADTASACAFSPPARPLDPAALFVTAFVALPLTRRALRPRKRGAGGTETDGR